jgi:hypothetical protein
VCERERAREKKWSIGEIRKWSRPKEENVNIIKCMEEEIKMKKEKI